MKVIETDWAGYRPGRAWAEGTGPEREIRLLMDDLPCRVCTKPSLLARGIVRLEPIPTADQRAMEWPVSLHVQWPDGRREWKDFLVELPPALAEEVRRLDAEGTAPAEA